MSIAVRSIALFVSGASVGLLLGLAISPALHLVIGATAALVGSIVGALAGVQETRWNVNPIPFAVFVVGLAIGSPLGIHLRTNDAFGPKPQVIAQRWSGTGLDGKEIQRRVFDQLYPAHASAPAPRLAAGLYSASADDCALLALRKGEELRSRLRALGDARLSAAAELCRDDGCLDALRRALCGKAE